MARQHIERIRHETRRRILTVEVIDRLPPRMPRISFTATNLYDFASASADDHIKLFFQSGEETREGGRPCMRDFTPRSFDIGQAKLVIGFALHEAGPATS